MSAIHDVVKEEYDRLSELVDFYNRKIASFPKGSISLRKRQSRVYYYLSYREHEKGISDYLGKEDSDRYREISHQVAQRLRFEKKLKEAKKSQKQAERLLRAAE